MCRESKLAKRIQCFSIHQVSQQKYFSLQQKDTKNNNNMGFRHKLGLTASMNVTLKTRNTYVRMDVDEFFIAFAGTSADVHSH